MFCIYSTFFLVNSLSKKLLGISFKLVSMYMWFTFCMPRRVVPYQINSSHGSQFFRTTMLYHLVNLWDWQAWKFVITLKSLKILECWRWQSSGCVTSWSWTIFMRFVSTHSFRLLICTLSFFICTLQTIHYHMLL